METIISKVHLRGSIFLKVDYTEVRDDNVKDDIKLNSNRVIHQDLADAIDALVPHFLLLTEMKKKPELAKVIDLKQIDEELLTKYRVDGVEIEDKKGTLSYTISGYKNLNTGKSVSFTAPKTRRMTKESNTYDFFNEMEQQIEIIKDEVLEYLGGKSGIREQTSMEFDEFDPTAEAPDETAADQLEKETAA